MPYQNSSRLSAVMPQMSLAAYLTGTRLSGLSPAEYEQASRGIMPWSLQGAMQQGRSYGFRPMNSQHVTPTLQRSPLAGIRISGLSPLEYEAALGGMPLQNMPAGLRMSAPNYAQAIAAMQQLAATAAPQIDPRQYTTMLQPGSGWKSLS